MIRQGQAPHKASLLLVGSGRLAAHFSHYLNLLKIPFTAWNRRDDTDLPAATAKASHVLLAVSDSAVPSLIEKELMSFEGQIVHFSGALSHPRAASAHPLMSFSHEMYSLDTYRAIHFTVSGADSLGEVLPGLPNSFSKLFDAEKARYHALCVLGGNFPVLLWNKMETDLVRMGIPTAAVRAYIQQVAANYAQQGAAALTGPLVRGDQATLQKNLNALGDDPWRDVYQAFVEVYK